MVFKLDDRRIPVPFTVVLCKDVQCFIILAMRDKPSRRLFYIISSVFLNIYIYLLAINHTSGRIVEPIRTTVGKTT
jgi:hypothetical protein